MTTPPWFYRPVNSPIVTLYEHTSYEVRCDLCDKPQEQGQTDVITFFTGDSDVGPTLK